MRDLALVPVIIVVLIVGSFVSPGFLMADNLMNVMQQSSELSILVIAQSLILICGKIDLSLESIVGVAPMFAAWLIISDTMMGGSGVGISGIAGIAVVLGLGILIGTVNALLVVKLRLNEFITTDRKSVV